MFKVVRASTSSAAAVAGLWRIPWPFTSIDAPSVAVITRIRTLGRVNRESLRSRSPASGPSLDGVPPDLWASQRHVGRAHHCVACARERSSCCSSHAVRLDFRAHTLRPILKVGIRPVKIRCLACRGRMPRNRAIAIAPYSKSALVKALLKGASFTRILPA